MNEMEIKVLGTGCPTCSALYKVVERAISELQIEATLGKEQDIVKIMESRVTGLPALTVDGKVISQGKTLTLDEVKQLLKQQL